ncbi:hypothetical protein N7530_006248 [Penicillium desertorum]|jgi:hypothetical protein|uniref:Uncharacterized protein n=1 Tax=Penicillium desertorum TaxID=1303715 RepID=A0A9W9WS39_9EURO|nr:hypothetical protein N7530_006248 [Penicillium desertorum]
MLEAVPSQYTLSGWGHHAELRSFDIARFSVVMRKANRPSGDSFDHARWGSGEAKHKVERRFGWTGASIVRHLANDPGRDEVQIGDQAR